MAASQEEEEEENNPHGENEKEVILLDIHVKNEAMENGAENETKENNKDSGESSGGRGQHFSTITDAEADLRDLMDFPNVAALYAADALSRDPRNQRRIGNKKKRNDHQENRGINSLPMPSQVLEGANNMILVSENDVSQQQIVGDAADGYLKSMLLLWERTKPASDGSAPKSALRADFSPSCLEGEKESADTGSSNLATIEGAIEKTTVVAEKNECVTDGAHVYLKSTSLLGERTEPTSDDSASKSASRTDFSSSYLGEKESADTGSSNLGAIEGAKEKATIVAEKNACQ
ncbi:hypothetical protein ACH5RR_005734 [Cinchona calisaya]|uniref:Uncharacterized protein n=1 Tax=Cinchona calisaya TaxID=153742 RepID=A0ABD3AM14_9GENT